MKLQVAGEELLLLPQKAVLAARADADRGRYPLRQGGVVPRAGRAGAGGTTSANLLALDELLALHPVRHILSSATSCTRRRRMRQPRWRRCWPGAGAIRNCC
jgi:hypothetical protein